MICGSNSGLRARCRPGTGRHLRGRYRFCHLTPRIARRPGSIPRADKSDGGATGRCGVCRRGRSRAGGFRQQRGSGVSGSLINSNLVVYDRRDDTLYPQLTFTSLNGPTKGEQLELLPVVETTWAMRKRLYPETTVPVAGTGLDRFSAQVRLNYTERRLHLGALRRV